MNSFSAKILKIGINPYVFVPEDVLDNLFLASGKSMGPIPVKGKLNSKPFIQTLVKYSGAWRLYLNTPMRKAAGIDVGDTARVQIAFDPLPRTIPVHPKLKAALKGNKKAKQVFDTLPPSRQKEIIRYIGYLKTDDSIERNVAKIIRHLNGKDSFAGRSM